MKQFDAEASGRKWLLSWASRFASTTAVVALALIAAPGAKADVAETFTLTGDVGSILGPLTPFTGTADLDFSNNFVTETLTSVTISVQGHADAFNQNVSLSVSASIGVIGASNAAGDALELLFAAPESGTWAGFTEGAVSFGDVFFSGVSGVLLGATGTVTRDGPTILDPPPPVIDPPPPVTITDPPDPPAAAVPELSTWAMLLLGLAGLGLAAKRRRASGFLGGKA
jgi:MYXO-CTERM domain-containing protein